MGGRPESEMREVSSVTYDFDDSGDVSEIG